VHDYAVFTSREQEPRVNATSERGLLNAGLRKLREIIGASATTKRVRQTTRSTTIDAIIELHLASNDVANACVEVKRTLRPAHLAEIEYRRQQCRAQFPDCEFLLVTTAVSEPLARQLRDRGLWFVDLAGNAYVEVPDQLLVFVVGQKLSNGRLPQPKQRLSEQAGRVLFQFVRHGPRVRFTYRDVVGATGVSLGVVSKLVARWREESLIHRTRAGEYEIVRAADLLQLWCSAFSEQLRYKILIGCYRSVHSDDLGRLLELPGMDSVVVGGEFAAGLLTGHLRSKKVHLYVPAQDSPALRKSLALAPSESGEVELLVAFSTELAGGKTVQVPALAHPALLYAELVSSSDDRVAETALRIRQEHLAWTL